MYNNTTILNCYSVVNITNLLKRIFKEPTYTDTVIKDKKRTYWKFSQKIAEFGGISVCFNAILFDIWTVGCNMRKTVKSQATTLPNIFTTDESSSS